MFDCAERWGTDPGSRTANYLLGLMARNFLLKIYFYYKKFSFLQQFFLSKMHLLFTFSTSKILNILAYFTILIS
jgi:hypothetical protein